MGIGARSRRLTARLQPAAATTIGRKSAAVRLAPPTSAPSTSGTAKISTGVRGLDRAAVEDSDPLPLFAIGVDQPPAERRVHVADVVEGRDLAGADRPDRLIGDREILGTADRVGSEASSWLETVAIASPRSRTSRLSPTHRMTRRPAASAASALARTSASLSCWASRRSLWPTMVRLAPASRSIAAEMQPVCAPLGAECTSWPPIGRPGRRAPRDRSGSREGTRRYRPPCVRRHRRQSPEFRASRRRPVHLPIARNQLSAFHRSSAPCRAAPSRAA